MADKETELEWEKSKRIEAEKMKAALELEKDSSAKINSAYLPIKKQKGFTRNPEEIMMSAEKMANASIIFSVLGVVTGILSFVAIMVSSANHLGLAGGALVSIIELLNWIGIGIGIITAIVALVCTLIFARKTCYKIKHIIITSCSALGIIGIYLLINWLVVKNS